jgi:hypothetical protein
MVTTKKTECGGWSYAIFARRRYYEREEKQTKGKQGVSN